jgi:PAS domain S-box-containing protein
MNPLAASHFPWLLLLRTRLERSWAHLWRSFASILAVLTLLLALSPQTAHASAPGSLLGKILVLHSYHPGFTWTREVTAGIMAAFREADPDADPFVEYLDAKRYGGPIHERLLADLFRHKFAGAGLQVVVTTDNAAFDFAVKHRAGIFPRAAIVFCGLNGYSDSTLAGMSNIAGVVEEADPLRTISLALSLHPDRRRVVVISDTTETGQAIADGVRQAKDRYRDRAGIEIIQNVTMTELATAVERLGNDSLIVLGAFNRDRQGRSFTYEEVLRFVHDRTNVPIYGLWTFQLGKGIVGGSLLSGQQQGEAAGRIALRIVRGERPESIGIDHAVPPVLRFDYNELKRFGISRAKLPAGSEIVNEPNRLLHTYRRELAIAASAFLALCGIIALLVAMLRQRTLLERRLRTSEQEYRQLVQNANSIILRVDTSGNITYLNEFAEVFFGYPATELVGKSVVGTITPERESTGRDLAGMIGEICENPDSYTHNVNENILRSGERVWISWANKPLADERGNLREILSIGNDITHLKEAQEEILRLNVVLEERVRERTAQLESSNRELESFCYSVSHDLRAPLRHINSYSRILLDEYLPLLDEQAQHFLQRLQAASHRMGQLIDDLLELSRVSRAEMECERVDLTELSRGVIEDLREGDDDRNVEVRITEGMTAWGDRRLLLLVLQNLIGNAWKYSSKREHAVIEVDVVRRNDREVFLVRDNGVGFDMAFADKLFGAFQRLHSSAEFEGTGIGLATVQRIVHRHGGGIWAEAEPDRGATFFFTLPPEQCSPAEPLTDTPPEGT